MLKSLTDKQILQELSEAELGFLAHKTGLSLKDTSEHYLFLRKGIGLSRDKLFEDISLVGIESEMISSRIKQLVSNRIPKGFLLDNPMLLTIPPQNVIKNYALLQKLGMDPLRLPGLLARSVSYILSQLIPHFRKDTPLTTTLERLIEEGKIKPAEDVESPPEDGNEPSGEIILTTRDKDLLREGKLKEVLSGLEGRTKGRESSRTAMSIGNEREAYYAKRARLPI